MSRSADAPITPTKEDSSIVQSPSDQPNSVLHSSHTSSSGGSSIYSSSSSSSRQRLSSGNTSPPCTLPIPSNSVGERDHTTAGSSKLHFSPANRSILQQSLDVDQHHSHKAQGASKDISREAGRTSEVSSSSAGPIMHSALSTSNAAASSSLSFPDNRRYNETASVADRLPVSGPSNGQRPANKARRTSSGGSRVPGEDEGRRRGQGGSSASDSGSDWPHGPKAAAVDPFAESSAAPLAESSSKATLKEADEQQASTSSNYFTSDPNANGTAEAGGRDSSHPHLDLATYPAQDLLRMLASLLAQIATANDHIRPKSSSAAVSEDGNGKHRRRDQDSRIPSSSSGGSISSAQKSSNNNSTTSSRRPSLFNLSPTRHDRPTTAALSALETPSSTLCFHARNVPSISIESYLLRILKYCPATNEVFLSLLIYFDRMSKMGSSATTPSQSANTTTELDMLNSADGRTEAGTGSEKGANGAEDDDTYAGMRGFAIDSYNVHRLVIAGVTVASKFFSDVFYTNSRYAKVGGLPVHELNQLELQFLLLNDFRLVIPLEEMQRYADQLLTYGGISTRPWSEQPTDGARMPGSTADRSAFEAVSRQERRDEAMRGP